MGREEMDNNSELVREAKKEYFQNRLTYEESTGGKRITPERAQSINLLGWKKSVAFSLAQPQVGCYGDKVGKINKSIGIRSMAEALDMDKAEEDKLRDEIYFDAMAMALKYAEQYSGPAHKNFADASLKTAKLFGQATGVFKKECGYEEKCVNAGMKFLANRFWN
jgi:hypothetical protein